MEPFDQEHNYDQAIAPLMTQIIEFCQRAGIPMIASFAYRRDGNGEYDLCTTAIPVDGRTPPDFATVIDYLTRRRA